MSDVREKNANTSFARTLFIVLKSQITFFESPKIMRALYLLFKISCADGHLPLRQNCRRDQTVFRELVLLVEYKKFSFYLLSYNAEFLRFQINLSPLPGPINTNVEVLRGFLIFQNIQSSPTAANWQM